MGDAQIAALHCVIQDRFDSANGELLFLVRGPKDKTGSRLPTKSS